MTKPDFTNLQACLSTLQADKNEAAVFAAVKNLLGLLGITEGIEMELFLDPDQKLKKNPSWTETNTTYNKPAAYELLKKNPLPVDGKLYYIDKLTQSRAKQLVALTPNYEDNPGIFLDKNIGIDFIVEKDCSSITIVLAKEYKIRSLTLQGTLTNTQKTILSKWAQDWGQPVDDDKYAANWKQKLHTSLWESFDISEVNKEFYRGIAERFMILVQHLQHKGKSEDFAKQFANRLIGRIIFCWFLDKKGFLNADQQYLIDGEDATEYYRRKLQKLFFYTLNTPQEERKKNPLALVGGLDEVTPFLNGGLFEPHDGDIIPESEKGFFPPEYFADLFEFLSHYHFTTDENTTDYQAVAIDPEMLGRIFENLLAELNEETGEQARKAKGAFYTPRPIVDYMCEESLWQYLKPHIEERDHEKLFSFLFLLKEHEFDAKKRDDPALKANKAKILSALDSLKVIDPAVGSGAFPMGMLQVMLKVYSRLDGRYDRHQTKLQIIRDNLFGVDIEPMAVEICRLRAWLSIMVDEKLMPGEPNSGIDPLPNLDFKFVCANSLIPAPEEREGTNMQLMGFDEFPKALEAATREYFSATTPSAKEKVKKVIKKLIGSKVQEKLTDITNVSNGLHNKDERLQLALHKKNAKEIEKHHREMKLWASYENLLNNEQQPVGFFEVKYFFPDVAEVGGFDIVIGNPPYIQLQKKKGELANMYQGFGYETFIRTGDIYCLFYERGSELSKAKTGILCYITSNSWMRQGYGETLRQFFKRHNPLQLIDFGGFKVFDATVDTNILILNHLESDELKANLNLIACHFQNDFKRGDDLRTYFEKNHVKLPNPGLDSWYIGNPKEIALKQKIEKVGIPLREWGVKINRGILTGFNPAFLIDQNTHKNLLSEDPDNVDIMKPIIKGKDIQKYYYHWDGTYVLATGFDIDVPTLYPSIYEHLKRIGDAADSGKIKTKGKGLYKRDDQGRNWWNLRACDFYQDFEMGKIAWIELADEGRFAYVEPGVYTEATTFIMTFKNPKYLLGIMNSVIVNWYFDKICGESGVGTNRWKKFYVEEIPLPAENNTVASKIESLVEQILAAKKKNPKADTTKLEREIDILVFKLYGLTEGEIKVVAPEMVLSEEDRKILGF